jgi:putative ABC transport system permease protein
MRLSVYGVAIENIRARKTRYVIVIFSISVITSILVLALILGTGAAYSLQTGLSRLGADLLVVPKESLINLKSALITGEPSAFYLDDTLVMRIRELPGVKLVAEQVFLVSATGECCILGNSFLIGFNPKDDFTVLPWVRERLSKEFPEDGAIVGHDTPWKLGETIFFYNVALTVWGRLERTGIGIYDNAIFFHINKAYEMSDKSQTSSVPLKPLRGKVSAILVQLEPGAKIPFVTFSIFKLDPNVKIVTTGSIITEARQILIGVMYGILAIVIALIISNVLNIYTVFSAIVNERVKEIGILRAIGASKLSIFKLILYESIITCLIGGILGIIMGLILLRIFQRSWIFYLKLVNVPFNLPPLWLILLIINIVIIVTFIMSLVGAYLPAKRASEISPYDAIREVI